MGERRTRKLYVNLSEEEYGAIEQAATLGGEWIGVWARDVLVSRALALHIQREVVMNGHDLLDTGGAGAIGLSS